MSSNQMKSTSVVVLAVGLALVALIGPHIGQAGAGFVAPNELVGYRACTHLMLRLVDCLIDACKSVQGEQLPGLQPSWDSLRPQLLDQQDSAEIGALGPNLMDYQQQQDQQQDQQQVQVDESVTKPMNWFEEGKSILFNDDHDDDDEHEDEADNYNQTESRLGQSELQTSGCWHQAIEWLRGQLLAVRMRLLLANAPEAGLADCLDQFAELAKRLDEVCSGGGLPQSMSGGQSMELIEGQLEEAGQSSNGQSGNALLDFILESIGTLAELEADSRRRQQQQQQKQQQPNPKSTNERQRPIKLSEQFATEAIKRQYSYLTQLVTTYNLIFNQI